MKDTIEFYYNLKINELLLENNVYHFIIDNDEYYFLFYNRDEKDLFDLISIEKELLNYNIFAHKIIYNNKQEPLTIIDDTKYILLKVQNKEKKYNILDMISFNKSLVLTDRKSDLYRVDWAKLWEAKNDYIENQLSEIKCSTLIHNSIDYYLGLSENAICYVNRTLEKYYLSSDDKIVLSRKRINYPNYHLNYFNPLSFIFDLEVRDIAEYIKSVFFASEDAFLELDTYLKSTRLSIYSYNMLFARLLYPSYYFDLYEKAVNNKEKEEELLMVIQKVSAYENFLKKAYKQISLYAPLEDIEYLKN